MLFIVFQFSLIHFRNVIINAIILLYVVVSLYLVFVVFMGNTFNNNWVVELVQKNRQTGHINHWRT